MIPGFISPIDENYVNPKRLSMIPRKKNSSEDIYIDNSKKRRSNQIENIQNIYNKKSKQKFTQNGANYQKISKNNIKGNENTQNPFDYESLCIENAFLKATLQAKDDHIRKLNEIAKENEKLRHANLKLHFELQNAEFGNPYSKEQTNPKMVLTSKFQNENKNLIQQISRLEKEKEHYKKKYIYQKDLLSEIKEHTTKLLDQNEYLKNINKNHEEKIQELNAIIEQMKAQVSSLSEQNTTLQKNDGALAHEVLSQLTDELTAIEQSFKDVQERNIKLVNDNKQLKEHILLYQELDSKMESESEQLRNQLRQLFSENEQLKNELSKRNDTKLEICNILSIDLLTKEIKQ